MDAHVRGAGEVAVARVTHDSRQAGPGDLFACLVGAAFDGHAYIGDALARGAVAVVANESARDRVPLHVPALLVPDTRRALPHVAAVLSGYPSRALKLVGVTGTNGKTTTIHLIGSILRAAGYRTGLIGTLGAELMGERLPSEHTTPEADQLQSLLADMRARGAQAVVMEVSSHAASQRRTDACEFDAAAFTNLTQDHLDYHQSLDAYFAAKARLFTDYPSASDKPFSAAVNVDDPRGQILARTARGTVVTFGTREGADLRALEVRVEPTSTRFRLMWPEGPFEVALRIGGAFQVYNALAAAAVARGLGLGSACVREGLEALEAVAGRFESVPTGRGFHVVVDYAHTPDGLENLLAAARRLKPRRVLLVFGCGGDRDLAKRPMMGRIAAARADLAIVTSDNPRTEDPSVIIEEIRAGMDGGAAEIVVEPDRRAAIALALGRAAEGDLVVVAGKGHETCQIVGGRTLPFDDRLVARELLGA